MQLPEIGDIFEGRFEISDVLGEGAYAVVLLARDVPSERFVALKLLKPDDGATYARSTRLRYDRELKIIASLKDAHTVKLFDYGTTTEGLLYLVFEHLPGQDLLGLLRERQRLEPSLVMHIMRQVLSSLREAHHQGLIHRDLKPSNLRVFNFGGDPYTLKVFDFGIARATDRGHPSVTATGEVIGTPRYMSPEQLIDAPLGATSDLYSLGMIAFELLFGHQVLTGTQMEEQRERLRSGHLVGLDGHDGITTELVTVLQRMTARQPEDRYSSAEAVLAALDTVGANPLTQRVPTVREDLDEAPDTSVAKLRLVVAVVVVLLGVLIVWLVAKSAEDDHGQSTTSPGVQEVSIVRDRQAIGEVTPIVSLPDVDDSGASRDMGADSGCGQPPDFRGLGSLDGLLAYVPRGYDQQQSHASVVMVHGDYLSARTLVEASGFVKYAEEHNVVLIAPEDNGGGMKTWRRGDDDVARVRSAFPRAALYLCLDPTRVFYFGHTDGGDMVQRASCDRKGGITAVAVNGYSLNRENGYLCTDPAMPGMWLHPLDSPHFKTDGTVSCSQRVKRSPDEMEKFWTQRNRCSGRGKVTFQSEATTCRSFACEASFEMCRVAGGTLWPTSDEFVGHSLTGCEGDSSPQIDVAAQVWRFFSLNGLK